MINYIKNIYSNETFDENIDNLEDLNNIITNFDILQFKSIDEVYNVLSISGEYNCISFDDTKIIDFVNKIKRLLKINNDDFYYFTGETSKICIITDKKVNCYLNNEGFKLIKDFVDEEFSFHTTIKVNKKFINKFKIDHLYSWDIEEQYKDNHEKIILSNNMDWHDIKQFNITEEGGINSYFVIEGNTNFIKILDD